MGKTRDKFLRLLAEQQLFENVEQMLGKENKKGFRDLEDHHKRALITASAVKFIEEGGLEIFEEWIEEQKEKSDEE